MMNCGITPEIEAWAYAEPLYRQTKYLRRGYCGVGCGLTGKIADRDVASPFRADLPERDIALVLERLNGVLVNIGADQTIGLGCVCRVFV